MVSLVVLSSMAVGMAERELPRRIDFTVKDHATQEIRFVGDELITVEGPLVKKVTSYRKAGAGSEDPKATAQEETVVYRGDTLETVSYRLNNFLTGEMAEVGAAPDSPTDSKASETYALRYVPSKGAKELKGNLKKSSQLLSGKVLHHVIVRNWQDLRIDKPAAFDLLVPFKLDSFRFQVAKVSESAAQLILRLQPDSWLIRKFVQPMDFFYVHEQGANQRLVRYEGPTTIDAYGNPDWKVTIEFSQQ